MAKQPKVYVSIHSLSEEQKKRLKGVILEVSYSMTRVESEKDYQKEALSDISVELGIDKKIVNKMAKTYFKDSFDQDVESFETFEQWYDGLLTEKGT